MGAIIRAISASIAAIVVRGVPLLRGRVGRSNHQSYCILMADYDSATPLYDFMPKFWDDSNRGKLPVAWGINPNLIETYPDVISHFYKTATEKTLKRKIREALLARRLESALTKEEILYLYLNNVYLGHHSYGVQAAAENYFRKDVKALTLGEMALMAGLLELTRYRPPPASA